jgi:hypothetical protein
MDIETDKIDDVVLALLQLTLHDEDVPGRDLIGTRSTGCMQKE